MEIIRILNDPDKSPEYRTWGGSLQKVLLGEVMGISDGQKFGLIKRMMEEFDIIKPGALNPAYAT